MFSLATCHTTLIKKKINFFPIYKEIQSGAVAKSYMRKGFPIYEEMGKYFPIYKGIVQPFELGGVTSLIRWAVKFCKAGHFNKTFLMIQSHERSLKQNSAA
jgi:hypothetical protein